MRMWSRYASASAACVMKYLQLLSETGWGVWPKRCEERQKRDAAEALLIKGTRLGIVLSFVMGVTLSLPSLIMLRKAVKPKLAGTIVDICTVGKIAVGYIFNALQYLLI